MHNYNKHYDNKKAEQSVVEEVVADAVETVDEVVEAEEVAETSEVEVTPPAPDEPKSGVVFGCKKLNVRKTPLAINDLNVVCKIEEGTKLLISEEGSTAEWYKVCLENGVEGYCMKKFINLAS